jgi:hypothetical protein
VTATCGNAVLVIPGLSLRDTHWRLLATVDPRSLVHVDCTAGECCVAIETGKIKNSFSLSDELELRGIAERDVTVSADGVLRLTGIVAGTMRVEAGGREFVNGTVSGR